MRRPLLLIPAVLSVLVLPSAALADHGGGNRGRPHDVRVRGTCGKGATARLRLRERGGRIDVAFEVEHTRAHRTWKVVIVRDGLIAWRGSARTRAPSGSFSVERRIANFSGADRVTARAGGPRGLTCTASAILPG
jgi:hypothetical protein